jgi:hypothetical protein
MKLFDALCSEILLFKYMTVTEVEQFFYTLRSAIFWQINLVVVIAISDAKLYNEIRQQAEVWKV